MKIVLVIKKFSPYGGVENFCYQFFSHLKARGCPVEVICGENLSEETGSEIKPLGLVRPGRFLKLFGFWLRTRRVFKSLDDRCVTFAFTPVPGCDIVRSGGSHLDFLLTTIAAQPGLWARIGKSVRRALAPINYLQYVLDGRTYSRSASSKYIAISSNVHDELLRRYDLRKDRIELIPNGVDTSRFNPAIRQEKRESARKQLGFSPQHQVLGFCSTNFELKGLGYLVKALPRLAPRTILVVAGRRNPEAYQRLARKLGVKDRIIFLGRVADMQGFYAALDALIHPSFYDTFGNVVAESLAMGVPVLTTSRVGASDLITVGVNGYLVDPKKTPEFAETIQNTLLLGINDYRSSVADTAEVFEKYYQIAQAVFLTKTGSR
jgi:UDP-glucose:(heptosyl)LPS alpha-1,3-glucosyltransferase